MKAGLLLVQRLTLSWDKRCRGLADAKLRSGFPLAQPLTERPAGWRPPGWGESSKALLHQLHFFQQPGKILTALEENRRAWAAWGRLSPESCRERMLQREKMIMGSCYQAFDSIAQLSLPNICLQQEKAGLRVRFCHDGRTDLPLRRAATRNLKTLVLRFIGRICSAKRPLFYVKASMAGFVITDAGRITTAGSGITYCRFLTSSGQKNWRQTPFPAANLIRNTGRWQTCFDYSATERGNSYETD